jgi:hypothetical protein
MLLHIRWISVAVLTAAGLFGSSGSAQAQPAVPNGPIARPTVSPYLNLLRGGNSAAFNYFSLVRPEQNAIRAFQGLQMGVANNQASINSFIGNGQLGSTGMPTQFLNYGGFFMNAGTFQGAGPGNSGGTAPAGRTPMGGRTNTGAVSPRR